MEEPSVIFWLSIIDAGEFGLRKLNAIQFTFFSDIQSTVCTAVSILLIQKGGKQINHIMMTPEKLESRPTSTTYIRRIARRFRDLDTTPHQINLSDQPISYYINQSKSQDSNQWINAHQCQLIAIIINRIINLLIMEY